MRAHMSFDGCSKVSSPTRYTWNVDLDRFFQLWNLWMSEVVFFASGFQLDLIVYNLLEKTENHFLFKQGPVFRFHVQILAQYIICNKHRSQQCHCGMAVSTVTAAIIV